MMKNIAERILSKIRQQLSIYQLLLVRQRGFSLSSSLHFVDTSDISDISDTSYTSDIFNTFHRVTDKEFEIVKFGKKIDCHTVNWHCDYHSGYCYPAGKRFDRIKINKFFNQGIDIIFPWQLSRFGFGTDLALHYRQSKDANCYYIFKSLVVDWIEKNPFLVGVNWICTMDVAIRAANWIVAARMFGDIFREDTIFVEQISKSLYNHGRYIEKFPEKFHDSGNNHLIADYSGLFLLALSFNQTKRGKRWLKTAKNGLEFCMEKQILQDGVDFENSIPYHRLALELLAVPVVVARNVNIEFSKTYYRKLFKMFEFVGAYMDSKGNAPQIGDNDSGRFLTLSHVEEQNHRYLLELGQQIFEYDFGTGNDGHYLLPIFKIPADKISLSAVGISPRNCNKSVFFTESGYYCLKNSLFTIVVFCPDHNRGGHRHFDSGSFTLSCKGVPIVVDAGSGVYTSNLSLRRSLRDYPSHNLYYREKPNSNNRNYFDVVVDSDVKVVSCSDNIILIRTNFENNVSVERKFILGENSFHIQDHITGDYRELTSAIHFSEKEIDIIESSKIMITGIEIAIRGAKEVRREKYLYSPSYAILEEKGEVIILPGGDTVTIAFAVTA